MSIIQVDNLANPGNNGAPAAPYGFLGISNGGSITTGSVGEIFTDYNSATATGTFSNSTAVTRTLQPGIWLVFANCTTNTNGAGTLSSISYQMNVGGVDGTTYAQDFIGIDSNIPAVGGGGEKTVGSLCRILNITTPTSVTIKMSGSNSAGNCNVQATMTCWRIG